MCNYEVILTCLPVSNVGLDQTQHVHCWLSKLDKGGIVDLSETKEQKNLSHTRAHSIDTAHEQKNREIQTHEQKNREIQTEKYCHERGIKSLMMHSNALPNAPKRECALRNCVKYSLEQRTL